jgi:NDP-sugar pyrophosphorylase family protein
MLNIVIPMAGRGSRFANEGYELPKPLIPVLGKPMIQVVINNLKPRCEHRFIFLCLKDHIEKYQVDKKLKEWAPGCKIVVVDKVTEGAACTVLLAKEYINNENPMMIANSDQWVDVNINEYLSQMEKDNADGLIMTMWADDPKWSFVKFDENNKIVQVVEKKVVSNEATVGIYNYRKGKYFVEAAEKMIVNNIRVNNEFYVAPAYDVMIQSKKKITIYNVGREMDGMYGMGIPTDLKKFEKLDISKKAIK